MVISFGTSYGENVQCSPQHTQGMLAQQVFNTSIFSIWEWGEFKSFDMVVYVGPVQTIVCLEFCLGKNTSVHGPISKIVSYLQALTVASTLHYGTASLRVFT